MHADKKRILVIEDAIVAQIAQASLLESLGYHAEVATTGQEAIQKTQLAQHYDLIFIDLGLPDVDALTVTESILTNYARRGVVAPPIVALTAHPYDSLQEACVNAGMAGFLAKPLTRESARQWLSAAK